MKRKKSEKEIEISNLKFVAGVSRLLSSISSLAPILYLYYFHDYTLIGAFLTSLFIQFLTGATIGLRQEAKKNEGKIRNLEANG